MPQKNQQALRQEADNEPIARRAHELWEQDGCRHGNDVEHWKQAERQLRGSPALEGNPAYPSKDERDRIVAANTGLDEPVAKIPADSLRTRR